MGHWRKMFDERFIGSWSFEDQPDAKVTIKAIKVEELRTQDGTAAKKPVLYFEKTDKGLVLNKTNAKTIAEMYGNNTDEWIGKRIVLFRSECMAFGKEVECVRVRNQKG